MIITANSLKELPEAAEKLIGAFPDARVFVFYGSLGAGKTTFIKEICRQLDVLDMVSSPTFALINEYMNLKGHTIYHFDFYRIEKPEEAQDIGFEEYLYSGDYCLIEWPEKVQELLPEDYVRVKIQEDDKGNRKIMAEEY
ncbi:MAG: tRNA (adenosine(37)-N6)-threonylcarbamoyltransferase complex ATPase subunit type 1 TsaE [Bacteroidales bacterium]|nr:tRNA (adenosine(37)-N6)-threonylcarbamoyltransferase complex ATPase subunit type 1 TsaE [Bacteroidales bacterium]MCF8333897.1 tRNA (adenosine(37)-N6)-threonylcarbamoyltransferase complex ATPase subunit type 1 TsaE [Bacteroidales bacterium]